MIIGEFSDVFPPELDGVGTVMKSYVEEFDLIGDKCYYIAPYAPDREQRTFPAMLYHSVKIPHEPYRVGLPILDRHYIKQAENIPFDIVHAHSPFAAGREALRLATSRQIPLVATFHSKYYDDFYDKTHSNHLAQLGTKTVVDFYNHCDEVWAVSEKTAEVLHSYGYQRDIRIMPNGTNSVTIAREDIERACEKYAIHAENVFLFVGQMNWKKNIRKILEAAALFGREKPYQLIMVGQGSDEQEIRAYAEKLGILQNTVFTGHITDRGLLMGIFARADLLVFPSLYDNAPMVVREAAATGTASILVRNSCAAECVEHGVNGLLSENTPESIAECMLFGIDIAKHLGTAAQNTIPIPWSTIIQQVRNRYVHLIEMKTMLSNK